MKLMPIFLLIILIIPSVSSFAGDKTGTLKVVVKGFENNSGKARLLLFTPDKDDSFPGEQNDALKRVVIDIKNKKAVFILKNIPYGKYAISVHHDEDNDGEIDTNWIGIPNEGLGTSNDAKGNFGPPSFEDASFELNEKEKKLVINIITF